MPRAPEIRYPSYLRCHSLSSPPAPCLLSPALPLSHPVHTKSIYILDCSCLWAVHSSCLCHIVTRPSCCSKDGLHGPALLSTRQPHGLGVVWADLKATEHKMDENATMINKQRKHGTYKRGNVIPAVCSGEKIGSCYGHIT